MFLLFGVLLQFFVQLTSVSAASSSFEFFLRDTTLTINFAPLKVIQQEPSQSVELQPSPPRFLRFEYRLSTEVVLDPDTIMLLLLDGERVLYALPAAAISTSWQSLTLDLAALELTTAVVPTIYVNQALDGVRVLVRNVVWLPESATPQAASQLVDPPIEELHAIREASGQLTLLVSVIDDQLSNKYSLHCLGTDSSINHSFELVEQTDWFWPSWSIPFVHANARNELIFQIDDFTCPGKIQISSGGSFSPAVDIVDWHSYATD